jgi:hypothetical protein
MASPIADWPVNNKLVMLVALLIAFLTVVIAADMWNKNNEFLAIDLVTAALFVVFNLADREDK